MRVGDGLLKKPSACKGGNVRLSILAPRSISGDWPRIFSRVRVMVINHIILPSPTCDFLFILLLSSIC